MHIVPLEGCGQQPRKGREDAPVKHQKHAPEWKSLEVLPHKERETAENQSGKSIASSKRKQRKTDVSQTRSRRLAWPRSTNNDA